MHAPAKALLFLSLSLFLVACLVQPAEAVNATVVRVDDSTVTIEVDPQNTVVKDIHFPQGALANDAVVNVTDDQGLGWGVAINSGHVNIFGSLALPTAPAGTTTTFTITLPTGVKWGSLTQDPIIFTSDGDNDPSTGQVQTIADKMFEVLPLGVPTLSQWGLIIASALILSLGMIYLKRKRFVGELA